jgi:DNA-binding NarL/FixJ family response regulator
METILIADDHEIVRMGIRSIIENQPKQYIVVEAATCAEVIQALSNHPVQFTILVRQGAGSGGIPGNRAGGNRDSAKDETGYNHR